MILLLFFCNYFSSIFNAIINLSYFPIGVLLVPVGKSFCHFLHFIDLIVLIVIPIDIFAAVFATIFVKHVKLLSL